MKKIAVCTLVVVGLAACARKDMTREDVSSTTITSATVEPAPEARVATFLDDDPALTRRIEASIAADPDVSLAARNVNVSTEGNIVTLSGSVESYAAREWIEDLVTSMVGKERFYDHVQVQPLRDADKSESDENIAFSLQRSLVDEPRVTIDVVKGSVTLRGEASAPETVERIAERTPGVASVMNELATSEADIP